MKQVLLIIFLLNCFLNDKAQNTEEEPDFAMGRSIKSNKAKSFNKVNLIKNLTARGIANLKNPDSMYGRYGVDISHHQGKINWDKFVADSFPNKVGFIVLKATQGGTRVDPKYSENFSAAKERGFIVGAYHFYSQKTDPEVQAANFIQNVTLEKGDLMPVLDIEKNCYNDCESVKDLLIEKRQLIQNLKIFISKLEQHYNTKVIIYTGESFYNSYLKNDFKDEFFWIAKYSSTPPVCFSIGKTDTLSNPCFVNSKKGCWQYSQNGKMKGIDTSVDINFINNYYLPRWIIN